MRIAICSPRWPVTDALAVHINACVEPIEHRFGDRIMSIAIRLTDINGPKGGEDKVCHLQAQIENHPSVNAEGRHMDLYAAIVGAARRLERSLGSILDGSRRRNPNSRQNARTKKPITGPLGTDIPEEGQDELPSM